jgi:hypothetical protein
VVPPELTQALRHLGAVRAHRPAADAGPVEFADWRERMAGALDALAPALLFEEDRVRVRAEAAAARDEAAAVRRRGGIRAVSADASPDSTPSSGT